MEVITPQQTLKIARMAITQISCVSTFLGEADILKFCKKKGQLYMIFAQLAHPPSCGAGAMEHQFCQAKEVVTLPCYCHCIAVWSVTTF